MDANLNFKSKNVHFPLSCFCYNVLTNWLILNMMEPNGPFMVRNETDIQVCNSTLMFPITDRSLTKQAPT